LKESQPVSHLNRKSFLRIADTVALLASCAAVGVVALKLGALLCGVGLFALGGAFLATDLWQLARALRQAPAAALPGALAWPRSSSRAG
jgi:hypothetical protein